MGLLPKNIVLLGIITFMLSFRVSSSITDIVRAILMFLAETPKAQKRNGGNNTMFQITVGV